MGFGLDVSTPTSHFSWKGLWLIGERLRDYVSGAYPAKVPNWPSFALEALQQQANPSLTEHLLKYIFM